ncbi:MFS transporter [Pseudofrankia inefficax]|uniref:Major facilitator superfamily MFS_1 n=1 Tax=Pseudofrankia inefficax (strain DSM 45817 / CECT 9037 / DDB 130130 / EuI1c) TaxID=298654 RepID=E3J176_PSEI1|nr:MFS transporter [Pseudofrankia inefficax]ADP79254.1 major facilitator superfamily MFS_1 [Pseudofrankia inefficax]
MLRELETDFETDREATVAGGADERTVGPPTRQPPAASAPPPAAANPGTDATASHSAGTPATSVAPAGSPRSAPPAGGTFAALRVPNYRRFMTGQIISMCGTWMQTIALGWLVLSLGASGTMLGVVTAAQFLPVLLVGAYGGLVADRANTRALLITTASLQATLAAVLGVLVITHVVALWMVVVFAALLGLTQAADNPARQSFVQEMVGPETLPNAVTLNSVTMNAARVVGPAIAGLLITLIGTGTCFLLNALSFAAVIVALIRLDRAALRPKPRLTKAPGQIREGFHYAVRTAGIRIPLMMMVITGTLAYEFQVTLPLVARETFHGTAATYSLLTGAMGAGAGAVVGGLLVARRRLTGVRSLVVIAAVFGVLILATAAAPSLPLVVGALVLTGAASVAFISTGNATVQLSSEPRMRGRVMALWSIAFIGTTPVGGPIAGTVAQALGARAGLVLAGVAALVSAAIGLASLRRADAARPVSAAARPTPSSG